MIHKVVEVKRIREFLWWVLELIEGEPNGQSSNPFLLFSPPILLHEGHENCGLVGISISIRTVKLNNVLGITAVSFWKPEELEVVKEILFFV